MKNRFKAKERKQQSDKIPNCQTVQKCIFMQRENRIFANKMDCNCKFSIYIFIRHYYITTYKSINQIQFFFLCKKRGENRKKSGRTIGAFSKYLRILGEVS